MSFTSLEPLDTTVTYYRYFYSEDVSIIIIITDLFNGGCYL